MNAKRILFTLASLSIILSTLGAPAALADGDPAPVSYGAEMTLETVTPIADIVADPHRFDGERVRVSGEVEGVCPMKGCWMNLRQGDDLVRIKVEDDVIVFPKDAVGSEATAEGVVELQELTREQYVAWREHLAEELGRDFDPGSVGDGPFTIVQIKGEGALIDRRDRRDRQ